jgi:hypothetical protein
VAGSLLRLIFRNWDVRSWTGSRWLSIGTGGGPPQLDGFVKEFEIYKLKKTVGKLHVLPNSDMENCY